MMQSPDIDSIETKEWIDSLGAILQHEDRVLTRSVPVPGDPGDVGNWLEPLGVASLITEGVVVILAAMILAGIYRLHHASRPWVRVVALARS